MNNTNSELLASNISHGVVIEVTRDTVVSTDEFVKIRKHNYKKEVVFTCKEFLRTEAQPGMTICYYIKVDSNDEGMIILSKAPIHITIN